MAPKACDHCFQIKEKCAFAPKAETCRRCQHLGITCCISRKKQRTGRRPVLKSFVPGSLQIWDVGRGDEADAKKAKQGRVVSSLPAEHEKSNESTALHLCRLLEPPIPYRGIEMVTDNEKFERFFTPFAMGRSFMPEFRRAIYSVLYHSAPITTDGYLAFLSMVARYRALEAPQLHSIAPDLSRGAKALQNLRNIEIMRPHDALCVLLLGQALFVFESLTDSSTTSAHSIIQSALISAKPWYPLLSRIPAFDTVTFCPVLMDIVCCLVHRRPPIIETNIQDRIVVDRYAGLCATLFPLLYRLCAQSHAAKSSAEAMECDAVDKETTEDRYSDIQRSIELWEPIIPPDFLITYGETERRMMTTQANAYRLAALLVIHRLRYPIGIQDTVGQNYANAIFSEISSFFAHSNLQGAGAFPVTFPLFISMFEVEGPGEILLEELCSFPIPGICMLRLHDFVKHVRRVKESGADVLWFDLVEDHLNFAVIP